MVRVTRLKGAVELMGVIGKIPRKFVPIKELVQAPLILLL
jgi:hypothetical protein